MAHRAGRSTWTPWWPRPGLPGHGPALPDLRAAVRAYRAHRTERLYQVRSALTALGVTLPDGDGPLPDAVLDAVTGAVYSDVDPSVLPAARRYSSCARTDSSAAGHSARSTSAYTASTTARGVVAPAATDRRSGAAGAAPHPSTRRGRKR